MVQRVANAEHHVEGVVIEMVGQLLPVRPHCPDRCPELLRQLRSPTNHRFAGVSCDNLHAKTGEANRQLSGSARTIEDVSVRRQETEDVTERRSELGRSQFCIRDEPLVHLGKRVITPHNYNLRHAADSRWHISTSAEQVGSPRLSARGNPSAHAVAGCRCSQLDLAWGRPRSALAQGGRPAEWLAWLRWGGAAGGQPFG